MKKLIFITTIVLNVFALMLMNNLHAQAAGDTQQCFVDGDPGNIKIQDSGKSSQYYQCASANTNLIGNLPLCYLPDGKGGAIKGAVINSECCQVSNGNGINCQTLTTSVNDVQTGITSLGGIFALLRNFVFVAVGIVLAGVIFYGGFLYMTSQGDKEGTKKAQSILTYAFVGIVVIAFAIVIIQIVTRVLGINGGGVIQNLF